MTAPVVGIARPVEGVEQVRILARLSRSRWTPDSWERLTAGRGEDGVLGEVR